MGKLYSGELRPPWPFCLNKDSPQAQGLVCWLPLGMFGGGDEVDLAGRAYQFTNNGSTVVADGEMRYARDFTDGGLTLNVPILTAVPITLACLFWTLSITVNQRMMRIADLLDPDNRWDVRLGGGVAGDPIQAFVQQSGVSSGNANSTVGFSASQWQHACAVFPSNATRYAFLDGGAKGTQNENLTPSVAELTGVEIGVDADFDGRLADARIYNRALSDSEVAAYFSDPRLSLDLYYKLDTITTFAPLWLGA